MNKPESVLSRFLQLMAIMPMMAATSPLFAQANTQTVALTGDHAPGTPADVGFGRLLCASNPSVFSAPTIDSLGRVGFRANLVGPGVNCTGSSSGTFGNDTGIWTGGNGNLSLVSRAGDPAPGLPDITYGDFVQSYFELIGTSPGIVRSTLRGLGVTQTNNVAYFHWSGGNTTLMLRKGDGLPEGPPGMTVSGFWFNQPAALNVNGQTAMYVGTSDSAGNSGSAILFGTPSNLQLGPHTGTSAPGTPSGVTFSSIYVPSLNASNHVFFYSSIEGPGVTFPTSAGLWAGPADNLALVMRLGDPAAGVAGGAHYSQIHPNHNRAISDSGQVAFWGRVAGAGIGSNNDDAIWVGSAGDILLAAREGDHAPGTPSDEVFVQLGSPAMSNVGVAFPGGSLGSASAHAGIWRGPVDALSLIVSSGDHAAGTEPETVFEYNFDYFAMNAMGDVALYGFLTGPDVITNLNDRGIWLIDLDGTQSLVARTGDVLEVGPGDLRTIRALHLLTGTANGYPIGLNDNRQIAFRAEFTDDSQGIFVATVPEPGSLILFGIASMLVRCRPKSARRYV